MIMTKGFPREPQSEYFGGEHTFLAKVSDTGPCMPAVLATMCQAAALYGRNRDSQQGSSRICPPVAECISPLQASALPMAGTVKDFIEIFRDVPA